MKAIAFLSMILLWSSAHARLLPPDGSRITVYELDAMIPDSTGELCDLSGAAVTAEIEMRFEYYGDSLVRRVAGRQWYRGKLPATIPGREYSGHPATARYLFNRGVSGSAETALGCRRYTPGADGSAHYYVRDHQGNVRQVTDADGNVEQDNHYYPYGSLMGESSDVLAAARSGRLLLSTANPRLFGGKEYITTASANLLDFTARTYDPATLLFLTPDPLGEKYAHAFTRLYCGADPVNRIDPSGCVIEGVTKKDAAMAVEDFRAMFPADEFANFRNLIVQSGKGQKGKSFAKISSDALSTAFSGISLNKDQQALVDLVVNTINSNDKHKVEYIQSTGVLSGPATDAFLPGFINGEIGPHMPLILERNEGLPVKLIVNEGGGGVTTPTKNGSHTLIILNGEHPNGRSVTTGHEILGHGRSWVSGFGYDHQHVQAIRTENLILRVMGIPFINTGINHGREKSLVPNPSLLPSFR